MELNKIKNKSVLLLGLGREGKDTLLFLRKLFPKKNMGIADIDKSLKLKEKRLAGDKNIKWHLGKNYLKALKKYEIIIKSPGIPAKNLPKNKNITSQTEIFFENCPGKIVGVTGTKGKSTTSSLIYKTLKKGGFKVSLLGNIGKPALTSLLKAKKNDIFVYELSCHQLYKLKKSPHIAVFLNVFPEHLDYYESFKEYARAKANIALYQTKKDYLIYNSKDKTVKSFALRSKAKKIPIEGNYYQLNKTACREVGKIFNVPKSIVEKTIKNFKNLPHRLELVGTLKGITFYNDSLATVPEATIKGIEFLQDKAETLILGGFDRGLDFKKLAGKIIDSKIKTLILFPATGEKIWKAVSPKNKKKLKHFFVNNMKTAVKLAYENTERGRVCLLSPASPSFGLFKNYEERGNLFKKYVRNKKL